MSIRIIQLACKFDKNIEQVGDDAGKLMQAESK